MSEQLTPDKFLQCLEFIARSQLRAIRALRRAPSPQRRRADGGKSNMQVVFDILTSAGAPLHIDDLLRRAAATPGVHLKRESVVSALTKKVLDHQTFCRVGRNRFGLLARDGGPQSPPVTEEPQHE